MRARTQHKQQLNLRTTNVRIHHLTQQKLLYNRVTKPWPITNQTRLQMMQHTESYNAGKTQTQDQSQSHNNATRFIELQ